MKKPTYTTYHLKHFSRTMGSKLHQVFGHSTPWGRHKMGEYIRNNRKGGPVVLLIPGTSWITYSGENITIRDGVRLPWGTSSTG